MTKVILLIVAVLVFFWLLRRALTGRKSGTGGAPGKEAAQPAPELVACAHCGVLLPREEAIAAQEGGAPAEGIYFCTEEHLKRGRR